MTAEERPVPAPLWRRSLNAARLVVGLGVLGYAAASIGLMADGLPTVYVSSGLVADSPSTLLEKVVFNGLLGVSMLAVTGVWRGQRVDHGQTVGGVWAGLWLAALLWLRSGLEFLDPSVGCLRVNCWPSPWQEVLLGSSAGIPLIVLATLGALGRPRSNLARGLVPVVTLVVLTVLQDLLWRPVVLPLLVGG
jgi:hypothetical protein